MNVVDDLTEPLEGFARVAEPEELDVDRRSFVGGEERPANVHLRESSQLQEWIARAEWYEREAQSDSQPERKARTLTVASELWAMAGNQAQALVTAQQASKLGSQLGQRQTRQLLLAAGDAVGALTHLTSEATNAETPTARAHAEFFAAELCRIKLADTSAALRHWEQGSRIAPSDPRPLLFKLMKQLGASSKPPSSRLPSDDAFQKLARAARTLAELRGAHAGPSEPPKPQVPRPDTAKSDAARSDAARSDAAKPDSPKPEVDAHAAQGHAAVAFVEATRAIEHGDRAAAAAALQRLAQAPEFARPARWLAAALLAPASETRPEALRLLRQLLEERGSAALRRILAARALEQGDTEAAVLALQQDAAEDDADGAFTPTDHLALGTLSNVAEAALEPWLDHAGRQDDQKPLVWAVISALHLNRTPPALNDAQSASQIALGRALGNPDVAALQTAALALRQNEPGHVLLPFIELEHARATADAEALARGVISGLAGKSPETQHQAHYAAGLICELNGLPASADRYYSQALRSVPFGEAAARALFERLPNERVSKLLATLADASSDPERQSLLWIEAVLHAGGMEACRDWCERAHDAAPTSPLPLFLGEHEARKRRDDAQALHWMQIQREQQVDDQERAALLLRASLVDTDPRTQTERVAAAWRIWPTDIALCHWYESQHKVSPLDRARAREQLAALDRDPVTRSQLLLEAAWDYEAAGALPDAARSAHAALPRQPLAEACFERTAPGNPLGEALKEQLHRRLVDASSSAEFAELYLKLAEIEARENHPDKQLKYLGLAAQRVPKHLPTLAELEAQALWQADQKHLLLAASSIACVLPPEDAPALVALAARLERLENGWGAAYPILKQTPRAPRIPLSITRQLLAHARTVGENAMAYEMTRRLCEMSRPAGDIAMLNLRAAELAARLEDGGLALGHVKRALEAEPRYLPALALHAKLLREQGQPAQAAAAYERLAQVSRVVPHQVSHWHTAATLWLDEVNDRERGQSGLEQAARLDPSNSPVFERLRALYQGQQEHRKLEALLNHRLRVVTDRENVAQLQLLKSQALVAAGDTTKAREALLLVIKASPENVEALTQLAELSERDGDALSAEHALLQLVRLSTDPAVQADVYQRLATLYRGPLANPKRVLRCYQEVLRRRPSDPHAFDAMLKAYVENGHTDRAVELLEQRASTETDARGKLELRLQMARLQASSRPLIAAAEQSYADLLTQWPTHPEVLNDAATFYLATERAQYVREWAERLTAQGRAMLQTSRLDPSPFEQLTAISSALGDTALAQLSSSAKELASGREGVFAGALGRAMSRHIDSLVAPSSIGTALRTLLMQTRGILDQALELNLAPLSPKRIGAERVRSAFEVKARAMGVSMPELFTTQAEPTLALVTGNPSRVVLGSYWVSEASDGVLDFIAWRTLKSDQARVGLFAQLDPKRLETVLLAFLSCFVEVHLSPPDLALFETTRHRVATRLSKTLDDDVPVLALEVLTQLRDSKPDLSDAVRRWINRSALLATGDPHSALTALAVLASGSVKDSSGSAETLAAKYPECRDVLSSLLDDSFVEAYRQARG